MKTIIILALIVLFFQISFVTAQEKIINPKFLRIKPAITSRAEAEKILGQRDSSRNLVNYKMSEELVTILYSDGDCSAIQQPWGIPKGAIEEVSYSFGDTVVPLSSVILDSSAFEKRHLGDVTVHLSYINEKYGLQVTYDEKFKTVIEVIVSLTAEQKTRFRCTQ